MSFNLEDMFYITGLRIDGLPVSGFVSDNHIETCQEHFHISAHKAKELFPYEGAPTSSSNKRRGSSTISLDVLKHMFELVPEDASNIEVYVKAFLLFLLGSLFFSSSSSGFISTMYLPLLSIDNLNKYAWGAAAYAHLK